MKIRIRGNTLRFRLSKSEVAQFAETGYLEERTQFLQNALVYCVKSIDSDKMSAEFIDGRITLFIPVNLLNKWSSSNLVGLDSNMPIKDGNELYLLIEKDFKCIDAVATEDQSDFFENPVKSC